MDGHDPKCATFRALPWLHPKRKLYNTIYKKTTFSLFDLFK